MNFTDAPADLGRGGFEIHADQIQLHAERGEVLAHRIVQKLRGHFALEFLRLERASTVWRKSCSALFQSLISRAIAPA